MRARGLLALAFIAAGLVLPLLSRWIVPLLLPGRRYYESAGSLLADRKSLFLFSAFSGAPFIALAVFAFFHLRATDPVIRRRRYVAVLVTFVALFVLGFAIHMPQTAAGVNFGVIAFPFYALLLAPVVYGLTRAFVR